MTTLNLCHVFLAFTQRKTPSSQNVFRCQKTDASYRFSWYSTFGKIKGERGFSCRCLPFTWGKPIGFPFDHLHKSVPFTKNGRESLKLVSKRGLKKWTTDFRLEHSDCQMVNALSVWIFRLEILDYPSRQRRQWDSPVPKKGDGFTISATWSHSSERTAPLGVAPSISSLKWARNSAMKTVSCRKIL